MAIDFSRYKKYDTSTGYGDPKQWKGSFSDRMGSVEAAEIIGKQKETVYTILGVTQSSTQAEIKKAFRAKIAEWHPDLNPHRLEEATAMAKKIIAAYTILKK